jgi:hypothetical protein
VNCETAEAKYRSIANIYGTITIGQVPPPPRRHLCSGSVRFWASRIRILPSTNKKIWINHDFLLFCDFSMT